MPTGNPSESIDLREQRRREDERFLARPENKIYYRTNEEAADIAVKRAEDVGHYLQDYNEAECQAFLDHLARSVTELIKLEAKIKAVFKGDQVLPTWCPNVGNPVRKRDYAVLIAAMGAELVAVAGGVHSVANPSYNPTYAICLAFLGAMPIGVWKIGADRRRKILKTYFEKAHILRETVRGTLNQDIRGLLYSTEKKLVDNHNQKKSDRCPKVSGLLGFGAGLNESKFVQSGMLRGKRRLVEHSTACYHDPESPKANAKYLAGESVESLEGRSSNYVDSNFIYLDSTGVMADILF